MQMMKRAALVLAAAAALGAAACDAGGHNDADEHDSGGPSTPTQGPDAAARGTQINAAPPPQGTVYPLPPDSNPSPSTPANPTDTSKATGATTPAGGQPAGSGTRP